MGILDIFNKTNHINYSTVKNEGLRSILTRFTVSKEDTVFVITSRICPTCSIYNRRIYSLYGRYKPFPILPEFLHNDICPTCGVHIGFSHYFPGISGNLKKDIIFSNKPLTDSRTQDEKKIWEDHLKLQQLNQKMEQDYKWICKNLPYIAPKSISSYKRMVSSNSNNYQIIVEKAKEHGYII